MIIIDTIKQWIIFTELWIVNNYEKILPKYKWQNKYKWNSYNTYLYYMKTKYEKLLSDILFKVDTVLWQHDYMYIKSPEVYIRKRIVLSFTKYIYLHYNTICLTKQS